MRNISVGTRLSIAFALVATVAMCSGIFDMVKINQINKSDEAMYSSVVVPLARLAAQEQDGPEQRQKLLGEIDALASAGKEQRAATDDMAKKGFKLGVIFIVCTFIFAHSTGLIIKFSITRPLKKVVNALKDGETGNMRARTLVAQEDEIGVVAKSVDEFFEKIQGILRNLLVNSDALTSSSEQLFTVSNKLASGAETTVSKSSTVAGTTEHMAASINAMASGAEKASLNANEVAGAAELISTNINTIASSIEQMSASINQIAGNTDDVHKIATDATDKATDATKAMSELGSSAKEIGEVTYVIKNIADKTNLLALNATIEAASAGAAGKGFTVVANEIKELANQSAKSADDITLRIEGMQTSTENAVKVISDVSDIIMKISESVELIAGHAQQQTRASNEIASNVTQANAGARRVASAIGEVARSANEVSQNAGETAKGASDVSDNALGMSSAAKESASEALQVNKSAGDLAKIAGELRRTVSLFKV